MEQVQWSATGELKKVRTTGVPAKLKMVQQVHEDLKHQMRLQQMN